MPGDTSGRRKSELSGACLGSSSGRGFKSLRKVVVFEESVGFGRETLGM